MKLTIRLKGGEGSGHRGHSGRPGKVGGSQPGENLPETGMMKIEDINLEFQQLSYSTQDMQDIMGIEDAIKAGEYIPPILVSRSGYLQDGRHRLAAYKRLGYEEVLVEYGHHPAATVIEKGGTGSGHKGHSGRPGKVGGSSPGSKVSIHLASEYVRLHNEASKEFKKAFKKVGANMWHDDDAHLIPKTSIDFIAETMRTSKGGVSGMVRSVYSMAVTRPLTVLDSYPEVTDEQKKSLGVEVDEIVDRYSAQWLAIIDEHFPQKGGSGSGHHGHSGRPGKVGGSVSGNLKKLYYSDLKDYYFHRAYDDTQSIIESGYLKGSIDNFSPHPYKDWRGYGDSPFIVFAALKSILQDFHSTMTNQVASNVEDTSIDDLLILRFDPEDKSFVDVSNQYVEKQLPIDEGSKRQLMLLRQELFFDVSDDLAEQLYIGEISIGQWEETMKSEIRQLHTSMAAIGAGGWDAMTSQQWGRLGTPLREQYRYLHGFAEAIAKKRDTISLAMLKSRSRLYGKAGGWSVVLMQAGAIIEDQLPYMPKDGSTQCLVGCRCQWSLTKIGETSQGHKVQAVWLTNPAEHCEDCLEREGKMVIINVPFGMIIPDKIGGL